MRDEKFELFDNSTESEPNAAEASTAAPADDDSREVFGHAVTRESAR